MRKEEKLRDVENSAKINNFLLSGRNANISIHLAHRRLPIDIG